MDNYGKLEEIVSVPNFIQKYVTIETEHFSNAILVDFCNIIKNAEYFINHVDNHEEYIFNVGENNYTVKRFIEFYLDKSSLKSDLSCKYEEELDLAESVSNEVFIVRFEDKISALCLIKYENELLYFQLM